jgi:pyruvate carboxylase
MVVTVDVRPGDSVAKGQKLLMLEAMKMQTTIVAPRDGKVQEVLVKPAAKSRTAICCCGWSNPGSEHRLLQVCIE